jgi:LacI family transcriptional regulator
MSPRSRRRCPSSWSAAGHGAPATRRLDRVTSDNRGGISALVDHLTSVHGHRDLAFVAGPRRSPDSVERFAGFRSSLEAAGLAVSETPDSEGHLTEAGGRAAVRDLLERRSLPDAIVCGNDEMAIGALEALRAAKVKVPAEVAVTGFDNIAATRHVSPPLTTVRQPMQDLGERGVRAVLARLADGASPGRSEVLSTEVVIRRSCGCRPRIRRSPTATPALTRRTA